ncbi:hypothetical protein COV18_04775 [Candidatus Woesearchaeota archaeon CG10_big_fil_rev_8_21_14_0_10_37_12]|nr:MAG: hypothetical protein COV18_04775 [Candidatus Woesearchaeota archaeon CG10_big_fil_rev_8_21_14_0_10_37_12]
MSTFSSLGGIVDLAEILIQRAGEQPKILALLRPNSDEDIKRHLNTIQCAGGPQVDFAETANCDQTLPYSLVVFSYADACTADLLNVKTLPLLFIGDSPRAIQLIGQTSQHTSDEALEDLLNKFIGPKNIDGYCLIKDPNHAVTTINNAVTDALRRVKKVDEQLIALPRHLIMRVLNRPNKHPYFKQLEKMVDNEFKREQRETTLDEDRSRIIPDQETADTTIDLHLISEVIKSHKSGASRKAQSLAKAFLRRIAEGYRGTAIGFPIIGEGGVFRLDVGGFDTPYCIARFLTDRGKYDPFELGNQRYRDARALIRLSLKNEKRKQIKPFAKYLNERSPWREQKPHLTRPIFLTAKILRPVPLTGEDHTGSFLLMEDARGPSLEKVLEVINETCEKSPNEPLDHLRKDLVKKFLYDCLTFQQLSKIDESLPEESKLLRPFLQPPSPGELASSYVAGLASLHDRFENLTPDLFDDSERATYTTALSCLSEFTQVSEEHIVRLRDSAAANLCLRLPRPKYDARRNVVFELADIESAFLRDGKVNVKAINDAAIHVDIDARYGALTEDYAHLVTLPQTRFLWEDTGWDINNPPLFDYFARNSNSENELFSEKNLVLTNLMCAYRAAKLTIVYADRFWKQLYRDYQRSVVDSIEYETGCQELEKVIEHCAETASTIVDALLKPFFSKFSERQGVLDLENWYRKSRRSIQRTNGKTNIATDYDPVFRKFKKERKKYAQLAYLGLTFAKIHAHTKEYRLNWEEPARD